MSQDTARRWISVSLSIATAVLAIAGGVWAASAWASRVEARTVSHALRLDQLEREVRDQDRTLARVANDVSWIRHQMQREGRP